MEHRMYSDAMTNYLVLRCPQDAQNGYQYRMLAVNRIKGLLPCSFRTIDGEHFLYYGITSRQSVARMYDHRLITGEELRKILYSMAGMIHTLSEFLLDPEKLLLDPEYILITRRNGIFTPIIRNRRGRVGQNCLNICLNGQMKMIIRPES